MGWVYFCIAVLCTLLSNELTEAGVVGVNYGMLGNNLPPPTEVVKLLKSRNITRIRLFSPDHDVLTALKGSGIEVIIGTLNQDLENLGTDVSNTIDWINTNVVPYADTIHFRCISAGNEVIPSNLATYVFPAMNNLRTALNAVNLGGIPVSTSVSTIILGNSYPPSQGEFSEDVRSIMGTIASFLAENNSPLLVNVYPYFSYIYNPNDISLSYALFNSTEVVVRDGSLGYRNLFDAIIDAVYSALEKVGFGAVEIVISESGWPSDENGDVATIPNAQMYNSKLIGHVSSKSGTPKRPGKGIETYVFAMFNENLKPPGTEQNFGLYYPNMTKVYHLDFK
ncbi:Glucan endo-1,3-beta-glucosidase GVI precursor [Actinidia chinensis var. chinensis]|uniref:Glucan endo-1,3-beta-glucosidase GVI n=1 Tax=Actinidia chinensis var. chinensis TaxID=1590841 RepID=A0A2R6PMS9_ACTCC|nr:Glucan endo-1,3-beta-glucosidase GVI precursor [Actinidia chinensis var. chinensis]